ncbi:hypothetical protein SLA2020_403030 [Shorea laevis]
MVDGDNGLSVQRKRPREKIEENEQEDMEFLLLLMKFFLILVAICHFVSGGEFQTNVTRFTLPIRAVAFNKSGSMLAAAGDEVLWHFQVPDLLLHLS